MAIEQIKEMVAGSEYDFLRTNPHLKDRIIFLTLGGSYSYGTNVETSDVGERPGVFLQFVSSPWLNRRRYHAQAYRNKRAIQSTRPYIGR